MTSPHLLVAQAVAAALREAGISCTAASWHEVVSQSRIAGDPGGLRSGHVVAILDGFGGAGPVDDLAGLARHGRVRIVVVTSDAAAVAFGSLLGFENVEVVTQASSVSELVDVMTRFLVGKSVMDDQVRARLRAAWVEAVERQRHVAALVNSLTPQQRRVLGLLASGHRVTEVAAIIGVTSGTVRSHVKSLRSRLGVRTQLEAVAMLHQMNVVGEETDGPDAHVEPQAEGVGHQVEENEKRVPRPRSAATEESEVAPRR